MTLYNVQCVCGHALYDPVPPVPPPCLLPDVDLLRDGLVAYDLWSHPGHRPCEGHLGALVAQLLGGSEVGDLHRVVISDQHAAKEAQRHWFQHCGGNTQQNTARGYTRS